MSTGFLSPPAASVLPNYAPLSPRKKRLTVDEFYQLGNLGWFEHSRPMLIDGEILEMPIPNPPHSTGVALVKQALSAILTSGFLVRTENPLVLGRSTDPVPDVAIVSGSVRDYSRAHPTTALLVVEISDSSLDYDTRDKESLYASAGIRDYWVVDVVNQRLHVFRDPKPDATKRFGFTFASVTSLESGQAVSPLALPTSSIAVADLLP